MSRIPVLLIAVLVVSSTTANGASLVEDAYIKPSNTQWSDNFGHSVAADGNTVMVGATGEDSNATGVNGNGADNSLGASGAAYVFVRDGAGNWIEQAYLKASDPTSGAEFGSSVAIAGNTAVVGAPNGGPSETGVAYVFLRDGAGTWSQQARLTASNADFDDQFGRAVAISGDTIVVGAHREDSNATGVDGNGGNNSLSEAGAAYVFTRDGSGNWSQQAYLKASNTGNIDQFGVSVSISGETVVIGASSEDSNATGVNGNQADNSVTAAGAAYVFVRDGSGVWSQQAYLKPPSVASNFENFGNSVSISGDTIVISAVSEDSDASGVDGDSSDNSLSGSGAAYVFVRDGAGNWSQQAYLKASNPDSNDNFGDSVAIANETIIVGAKSEDSSAIGIGGDQSDNSAGLSGAAYTFLRDGSGAWSQTAYVKASNAEDGDLFGQAVAASSEILVAGAQREDSSVTGINGDGSDNSYAWAGAAYAFFSIPSYSIGGSVTGLQGSGLVLQNNDGDDRPISSDGPFTFPTELANGETYDVTVSVQPTAPEQICSVTPGTGTGTITGSDVTDVMIVCATNQPPVANDDVANTRRNLAVGIDAIANDTDVDGNLDATTTNTACGTCSDPADGELLNNGDGTFEYTPDTDFIGSDSFAYQICDTVGACDTATVGITVEPPSADTKIELLLCTDRTPPAAPYAYGLRVVNAGPDPAEGVAVTHTPVIGATVTSISDPSCLDTGTTVDCDLGTLASGAEVLIGVFIQAPGGGAQSLSMNADVVATTGDPNTADNSESETVEVIPNLVVASSFESCTPP